MKWEDSPREDLRNIPKMKKIGFEVEVAHQDRIYERTTVDNVPHFPVNFRRHCGEKGILVIWSIRGGWQTAFIRNGRHQDHHPEKTLKEAVEYHNYNFPVS